jgi:hypothetical protein
VSTFQFSAKHGPIFVDGHALRTNSGVDGPLGLDFLRDQVLTIDFRAGQIDLS